MREALAALGEPRYRLDQVRKAVFEESVSSYEEASALPTAVRRRLCEKAPLLRFMSVTVTVSGDGRARKAVATLVDGQAVETVLLRPSATRWTACVSTQVGCAIACSFCATGLMGLSRNLDAEEIADQVLFWRQYMRREGLPGRLDNVVYMGMGEPFANYEATAQSLKTLMDQKQFGIGARHISVSTSGLAPQIERFGKEFPQVNLALSLHAADDALRTRLVPVNKAYPLAKLASALKSYLKASGRKIFFEYVLLQGENDRPAHARRLVEYLKSLGPLERLHANLIVFNQTDTRHRPSTQEDARAFQALLLKAGVKATVRQNLGRDIEGACGQLIVRAAASAREPPSAPTPFAMEPRARERA